MGQDHHYYPGTECGICSPGGPHSQGAPQPFFLLLFLPTLSSFPCFSPIQQCKLQKALCPVRRQGLLITSANKSLTCHVCMLLRVSVFSRTVALHHTPPRKDYKRGITNISVVNSISLPLLQDKKVKNWHITRATVLLVPTRGSSAFRTGLQKECGVFRTSD